MTFKLSDLGIPGGGTVTGIQVVNRCSGTVARPWEARFTTNQTAVQSGVIGNLSQVNASGTSMQDITHGNSTSTFGLNSTQLQTTNFNTYYLAIAVFNTSGSGTYNVDSVKIRVWYTP